MDKMYFKILLGYIFLAIIVSSCQKDEIVDPGATLPTEILADNNWVDSTISGTRVLWFKVTGAEGFTTLYIEWAEADFHGESKSYTGDIKVSAYMLDGTTPYFENIDTGYKDKKREIALISEKEVLVKVELNDLFKSGSFSLRATGVGEIEITYITLPLADAWTTGTISDGEIIGYTVDCGDTPIVQVIWAEVDSPEGSTDGYTADINGSVFHKDAQTPYKQYGKDDDFLKKNKSHSDNPKAVEVDASEKKIKIQIGVELATGTYAIKVLPYTK